MPMAPLLQYKLTGNLPGAVSRDIPTGSGNLVEMSGSAAIPDFTGRLGLGFLLAMATGVGLFYVATRNYQR